MIRIVSASVVIVFLSSAIAARASAQTSNAREPGRTAADCTSLTKLTFEGNTSITSAVPVTSGTLQVGAAPTGGGQTAANTTLTNLPPFCRVQGVSKPSADSNIAFEVWLPEPQNWNTRFLS